MHVSTSFVNTGMPYGSRIKEKIYEWPDFEETAKEIEAIDPAREEQMTKSILDKINFPNTYTTTKNMAEQYL